MEKCGKSTTMIDSHPISTEFRGPRITTQFPIVIRYESVVCVCAFEWLPAACALCTYLNKCAYSSEATVENHLFFFSCCCVNMKRFLVRQSSMVNSSNAKCEFAIRIFFSLVRFFFCLSYRCSLCLKYYLS